MAVHMNGIICILFYVLDTLGVHVHVEACQTAAVFLCFCMLEMCRVQNQFSNFSDACVEV